MALVFAATVPGAAEACRTRSQMTPLLYDAVPELAPDLIAAEVEITRTNPLEGRIVRMIRGEYSGSLLRLEPQYFSSCDAWPRSGQRGIAVGRVLRSSNEALVIDPIRAPSFGRQLELQLLQMKLQQQLKELPAAANEH